MQSMAAIEAQLKAELQRESQRAVDEFQALLRRDDMRALACVPQWTVALARRVERKLATGELDLQGRLARRVLEQIRSSLEEDQTEQRILYVMPDPIRRQVYKEHASERAHRTAMWEKVQHIASVLETAIVPTEDPQDTHTWAVVVTPSATPGQFVDRIDAFAGGDGLVSVWDLDSGVALSRWWSGHTGAVISVALGMLGDRPVTVTGGTDETVRVSDGSGEILVVHIGFNPDHLICVDGSIVIGGSGGLMALRVDPTWNARMGRIGFRPLGIIS
jgi:hypothetical protein